MSSLFRGWRPRPYLELFYPLVAERKVRRAVVLMGPRRVGKTVMIHHTIQRLLASDVEPRRIFYVSVDHPLYNGLALEELLALYAEATGEDLRTGPAYVFFDEIQYLRDWEAHLKSLVDSYPELRCVSSGSAAAALRLKSHESGAGRFTDFLLPPLTFHEYLVLLREEGVIEKKLPRSGKKLLSPADVASLNRRFVEYLNFGGYPEAVFSEEIQSDPARFIKSDIIDKVLLRDLPSLYGIQDIQELNSLFTRLAYNTAGEVSLDELSKGSGVAKNTIKRYIEYLEAAFLISVVHRLDRDARRFKRAVTFKVYLTNPSMRAALFAPVTEEDPAMGPMVETAIVAQWLHWDRSGLHYARWPRGEVDVVILNARGQAGELLEVKWSDRIVDHLDELKPLADLALRTKPHVGATVTTRTRLETRTLDGVPLFFMPASVYCYLTGRMILSAKGSLPGLAAGELSVDQNRAADEP
ncbi:MAG TPA: ATP-binding protein [Thermoanaerobaculia bacterium]|nr:ATP-binding protein [Thermoanaerobaculia bacterium]